MSEHCWHAIMYVYLATVARFHFARPIEQEVVPIIPQNKQTVTLEFILLTQLTFSLPSPALVQPSIQGSTPSFIGE